MSKLQTFDEAMKRWRHSNSVIVVFETGNKIRNGITFVRSNFLAYPVTQRCPTAADKMHVELETLFSKN